MPPNVPLESVKLFYDFFSDTFIKLTKQEVFTLIDTCTTSQSSDDVECTWIHSQGKFGKIYLEMLILVVILLLIY